MAAPQKKKLSFGLVGSETLRGREIRTVLGVKKFPLKSLEFYDPDVDKDAAIADLEAAFRRSDAFELTAAGGSGLISAVNVAGKDRVFVGQIKKAESVPGGFWIWAVADNLTLGSALNAYGIARSLFKIS